MTENKIDITDAPLLCCMRWYKIVQCGPPIPLIHPSTAVFISHTPINCCFHMIEWDSSFNNIWHVLLFFTNSTYVEYGTTYWDKIGRFYYLPKYGMIYACYHFKNIWRVLLLFTHITYLEYGTTNCDRIRKFHYLPVCIIVLRCG
jgi:hypothetical protein